jgi:hypothetical protein
LSSEVDQLDADVEELERGHATRVTRASGIMPRRPMKHLVMTNLYLVVAVFFYLKKSLNISEELDKREFLSGSLITPNMRALCEFFTLVFSLAWIITIPIIIVHRFVSSRR